jgi:hypothetical protein
MASPSYKVLQVRSKPFLSAALLLSTYLAPVTTIWINNSSRKKPNYISMGAIQ